VVITNAEGTGERHPFAGWLELLGVLEALAFPPTLT
jgi:hypothetical protein